MTFVGQLQARLTSPCTIEFSILFTSVSVVLSCTLPSTNKARYMIQPTFIWHILPRGVTLNISENECVSSTHFQSRSQTFLRVKRFTIEYKGNLTINTRFVRTLRCRLMTLSGQCLDQFVVMLRSLMTWLRRRASRPVRRREVLLTPSRSLRIQDDRLRPTRTDIRTNSSLYDARTNRRA